MDNNNIEATTEVSNNIYYNDYIQDHIRVYHIRIYHTNFESIKIMITLSFFYAFEWVKQPKLWVKMSDQLLKKLEY